MTETPPFEEWLLTTTAIPYWAIALVLLITVLIFAVFNVQAGQPTSNPSDIQKRFGLSSWTRRTAHFVIGLWGCALAMLMGAFFLTSFQLIQEVLATSNQDAIRHLAIALPAVAAASAGLIALPITLNRLQLTNRQTQAEEEGLITDRINAAVLGLGAEKTVKVTEEGQVVERTEPNIEVRIGAILALERIAQKNLDVHIQIMEILCEYLQNNCFWMPTVRLESDESPPVEKLISPRADIQRALKVLGTKSPEQKAYEIASKYRMSIRNCDFSACNLRGLSFIGAIFYNCNFLKADAYDTNFKGARFVSCNFDFINISRSDLTGAQLEDVNWNHAASRITTLPNSVRGLIVIKSELNAVLSLPRGQENFIYSTYDTLWGASEGSKAANDLGKLMLGGVEIDEETERKSRLEAQTKFQLRFFSWHPSSDLFTPYEIDAFRREIGHLGFPYTDE